MGKHTGSTSEFISIGGEQVTQKLKSSTSPSIWGVLLAGAPECDELPWPKNPALAHTKDRRHADTAHPGLPNTSIRLSLTLPLSAYLSSSPHAPVKPPLIELKTSQFLMITTRLYPLPSSLRNLDLQQNPAAMQTHENHWYRPTKL